MRLLEGVGERLKEWAIQIRNARVEVIADITKEAIKDLASKQYFDLPNKFIGYIENYERKEGALQSIADYRDHFIHPFHVFCLGYQILKEWSIKFKENSIKSIPLELSKKKDNDYNLKLWFITSIYHDVGYPCEKLEILINDFFKTTVGRNLKSQYDWSSVILAGDNIKHIDRLSDLYLDKSNENEKNNDLCQNFEKWFHHRLLEDHDHGALSSLMLLNQGWEGEEQWRLAYEASLAIALHSYRNKGKNRDEKKELLECEIGKLAVEDFPLAFFLSYCDDAQEWGRKILLELIRKIIKSNKDDNTQFLNGLNNKLKKPVPILSKEPINGIERITTKVVIKYPSHSNEKVSGDKTIQNIFEEVAKKFESTWYLRSQKEHDFWIQGIDIADIPIGNIHPAPQFM